MNPFALLNNSIYELLLWLNMVTGSFGYAILALTVIVRGGMVPLTLPGQKKQIENRDKMQALKPEIKALKNQHKDDKAAFAKAQMDLFKKHNIQLFSFATLLPFLQLIVLFSLYHVLLKILQTPELVQNTAFLGFDLLQKDSTYILPVLSAVLQFLLSLMILPGIEKHNKIPNESANAQTQKDNEQETDQQEMAEAVQQQMVYFLPAMTFFFSLNFPAAVVVYWIASTVFSMGQQYAVSGWGGLEKYVVKIPVLKNTVSAKKSLVEASFLSLAENSAEQGSSAALAQALQNSSGGKKSKVKETVSQTEKVAKPVKTVRKSKKAKKNTKKGKSRQK